MITIVHLFVVLVTLTSLCGSLGWSGVEFQTGEPHSQGEKM